MKTLKLEICFLFRVLDFESEIGCLKAVAPPALNKKENKKLMPRNLSIINLWIIIVSDSPSAILKFIKKNP